MNFGFPPILANLFLSCFPLLSEMSLEQKVGQLFMVQFHGEEANEDARILIQETKVGGIIYYNWCNGLYSPAQVKTLSASLQTLTQSNPHPIPLFIATDQEGGVVARLQSGFTVFPGNRALGETDNPSLAKEAAFATGTELQAVGINMNLAPVVDINNNPRNPVIGIRSFGERAETVLLFAEQALSGYQQAHIIVTLKHFPGHGDTTLDSHENLPIVHKSKEKLEQMELLPFTKLTDRADAIMTAHILVPAFDTKYCSTLSERTLNYLRQILGFRGVIVSDSLVMEGILKQCDTVDEAAILALNAGCDLLILGGKLLIDKQTGFELKVPDINRIHKSVVRAIEEGRLSQAKIDQSVERILTLKKRYLSFENATKVIDATAHRAIAEKIASLAIKIIQKEPHSVPPLHEKHIAVVVPKLLQNSISQTALLNLGQSTNVHYFSDLNPSQEEIEDAKRAAATADVLLICAYNAWKNPSQTSLIQFLLDLKKTSILLVTRDPLDADLFPTADLIFKSFSPTSPSFQVICDQLKK